MGPSAGLAAGKSHPHRDSIPDRPACIQSLCRLSYPVDNRVQEASESNVADVTFPQLVKNTQKFFFLLENEAPLSGSQQQNIHSNPEPDESIPRPCILLSQKSILISTSPLRQDHPSRVFRQV